jgi:hypothetical protein
MNKDGESWCYNRNDKKYEANKNHQNKNRGRRRMAELRYRKTGKWMKKRREEKEGREWGRNEMRSKQQFKIPPPTKKNSGHPHLYETNGQC